MQHLRDTDPLHTERCDFTMQYENFVDYCGQDVLPSFDPAPFHAALIIAPSDLEGEDLMMMKKFSGPKKMWTMSDVFDHVTLPIHRKMENDDSVSYSYRRSKGPTAFIAVGAIYDVSSLYGVYHVHKGRYTILQFGCGIEPYYNCKITDIPKVQDLKNRQCSEEDWFYPFYRKPIKYLVHKVSGNRKFIFSVSKNLFVVDSGYTLDEDDLAHLKTLQRNALLYSANIKDFVSDQ